MAVNGNGSAAAPTDKQLATLTKKFEGKIATLGVFNSALQSENDKLREQLSQFQSASSSDLQHEIEELKEEFGKRLGASDKTLADLREERDQLRLKLQVAAKGDSASTSRLKGKDDVIERLQREGETQSKKLGEQTAVIKKLRSELKDATGDRDRAQQRCAAWETKLMEATAAAERAAQDATSRIEHAEEELARSRAACDRQVAEAQRKAAASIADAQAVIAEGGAEQLAAAEAREAALSDTVTQLREALEAAEADATLRLEEAAREVQGLQAQLQLAHTEVEALKAAAAHSTAPLVAQLQSLLQAASRDRAAADATEQGLLERSRRAEREVQAVNGVCAELTARLEAAELGAAASKAAAAKMTVRMEELGAARQQEAAKGAEAAAQLAAQQDRFDQAAATHRAESAALQTQLTAARQLLEHSEASLRALTEMHQAEEACSPSVASPANRHSEPPLLSSTHRSASSLHALGGGAPSEARDGAPSSGQTEHQRLGPAHPLDAMFAGGVAHPRLMEASEERGGGGPEVAQGGMPHQVDALQDALAAARRAQSAASQHLLDALRRANTAEAELSATSQRAEEAEEDVRALEERLDLCMEVLGGRNQKIAELEEDVRDMTEIFHDQLEAALALSASQHPPRTPDTAPQADDVDCVAPP